jgi:hypothetical protein
MEYVKPLREVLKLDLAFFTHPSHVRSGFALA